MRSRTLAVALFLLGSPLVLSADQLKPRLNVDFGAGVPKTHAPSHFSLVPPPDQAEQKKQLEEAARLKLQHVLKRESGKLEGFDCRMVKPVDPDFRSAMPVVEPPKHTTYTMKIVPAPPCREVSR
jgi:hypothetical protein